MKLSASSIYSFFRPSECGLRITLKKKGIEEAPPGPYEQVLERLGAEHEKRHLATFPSVVDISSGTAEERVSQTKKEVSKCSPVIYQALLRANRVIEGTESEISGVPDFLVAEDGGSYIIRDSKISRRINEKDHREIILQMCLYGWLYEQTFGQPPHKLQVHSGTGDIVDVPYDGGAAALETLDEILRFQLLTSEPYSPVGWSKCNSCGFYNYCWPRAQKNRDIAIVAGVDQGMTCALRGRGIETIEQLLESFTEEELADFSRPWGKKSRRVGKDAAVILRMARAMTSGKEIVIQTPAIPAYTNYVMFDLEGLPSQLDETEKIYLWGMQIFSDKQGKYIAAVAGFGEEGDRQGWEDFLVKASSILSEYGDVPFVHWHHYEKDHIKKYIERFGDHESIAERILTNLLDLLPITQESIALPLPSYSLKVVEQYIGFKRTQYEYGGDWAMAKYIEATEMEDEKQRAEVMNEILKYNQEDLEATWVVLQWLKSKVS